MSDAAPKINVWKILLPVSIGVSVSVYLIATNFHPAALSAFSLSSQLFFWISASVLTVIVRDTAFMYKIRLSTGNKMTWRKTFQTVMIWEFSSCIFPKVSEAGFVLYLLKKSGLSYGKSAAVLMLNSFFDNLTYIVLFCIAYLLLKGQIFEFSHVCPDLEGHSIMQGLRNIADMAWIGLGLIVAMCTFLGVSLFIIPHKAKQFFHFLASLTFLSRFKTGITHLGDDIELTASEFKNQSFAFWTKMTIANFLNWTARYLLAFTLLMAFATSGLNFLEVFARQFVLWIFISIPSTPGASGVAEISFMALNCEFMPVGLAAAIALLWRVFSYYLYLIIGMVLLPKWAKQIAEN
jgi:uncharacterized membrane protein YbhN (UPF0104 family)